MYQRMQALVKDGTLEASGVAGGNAAISGAGGGISEMDAFSQKLAAIVASDYTHAALVCMPAFFQNPMLSVASCKPDVWV